jgi:hypothetical protein
MAYLGCESTNSSRTGRSASKPKNALVFNNRIVDTSGGRKLLDFIPNQFSLEFLIGFELTERT